MDENFTLMLQACKNGGINPVQKLLPHTNVCQFQSATLQEGTTIVWRT